MEIKTMKQSEALPHIKILVVDDERSNRILMTHYLEKLGQTVVVAEDGNEAIEQYERESPDLIIMDVVMAGMDGYEATQRIKKIAGKRWIPIIFASALTTADEQIKGLDIGGDDYLLKPVNYAILASKIRAMQRILAMQQALADSLLQLEKYKKNTEEELTLAKYIMRKLTFADSLSDAGIEQFSQAAGEFSGDVVAAAYKPDGLKYILLADVTGHGLSSALNSIPLVDVFYELAERDTPPEELCRQMNLKLKRVVPAGYFVALVLAVIDSHDQTIRIWNGGLPSVMYLSRSGKVLHEWKSRHMAMGILDDKDFESSMTLMKYDEPGQLIIYTDGLTEAESSEGEEFGVDRMMKCLSNTDEKERIKAIEQQLLQFLNGQSAHDDVSMVAVNCA